MCINMPKTIKEGRLRWVLPIYNKEIKLKDVAKVCPYSQRSLERGFRAVVGLASLLGVLFKKCLNISQKGFGRKNHRFWAKEQ